MRNISNITCQHKKKLNKIEDIKIAKHLYIVKNKKIFNWKKI